jgi:gliding motility-associated-like protein
LHLDFTAKQQKLCAPDSMVQFKDSAHAWSGLNGLQWNFGDGKFSNQANPLHYYQLNSPSATYSVLLTITSKWGCVQQVSKPNCISHYHSPRVNIQLLNPPCVNQKITLAIKNQSATDSLVKHYWYLNGIKKDSTSIVSHVFDTTGNNKVNLMAISSNGCMGGADTSIFIHAIPKPLSVHWADLCIGGTYQLMAAHAHFYKWIPSTYLTNNAIPNPIAQPTTSITYSVIAINQAGCKGLDSIHIQVDEQQKIIPMRDKQICIGDHVQLSAMLQNMMIDSCRWYPSIGLNNSLIANPIASPTSSTTYMIVVPGNNACKADTAYQKVEVHLPPHIKVVTDSMGVDGSEIQLHTTILNGVVVIKYEWIPAEGLSCTDCSAPSHLLNGSATYTVKATSLQGCVGADLIHLKGTCVDGLYIPSAFTPNNDLLNEVFYIKIAGYKLAESLLIFNRWGEVVFQQENFPLNNPVYGWNGTYKGVQAKSNEVYSYLLKIKCDKGKNIQVKGSITIID